MNEKKEENKIVPRRIGNFAQDGRQYGRTSKGTMARINPATGNVVPRVRLSKKERLRMRKEMKAFEQASEGSK